MKRSFSNAEILDSVELLLSGNSYSKNDKKKVRDNYKRFNNKSIKMKDDTFEIDSIELVKPDKKKSDTSVDDSVRQKKEDTFEIDSIELVKPDEKKSDTPADDSVTEKIILDAEDSLNSFKDENKLSEKKHEEVLVLKDELVVDDIIKENNPKEETFIDEENRDTLEKAGCPLDEPFVNIEGRVTTPDLFGDVSGKLSCKILFVTIASLKFSGTLTAST